MHVNTVWGKRNTTFERKEIVKMASKVPIILTDSGSFSLNFSDYLESEMRIPPNGCIHIS